MDELINILESAIQNERLSKRAIELVNELRAEIARLKKELEK